MFCLRSRKTNNIPITRVHKWTIYLIGLFETLIFSACLFGWAQLVFVLKNEEIFLNLCESENFEAFPNASNFNLNASEVFTNETFKIRGCPEQDQAFAVVYIIGNVALNGIGSLSGLSLYYFGLVATRIYATTALIVGFLALGLTNKEHPFWLYISITLLAIGGTSLKTCGLQFCNLFPRWRSTSLTIISGSFSASSGLFLLFQIGQQYGISLWNMSFVMSLLASLSLSATIVMPWHHIPYDVEGHQITKKIPFRNSLFSVSYFTSILWFIFLAICVRFYALIFNSWTSQVARTYDEVAFYSILFSSCACISPIVTPLPGIFNDVLTQRIRRRYPNKKISFEKELKIPIFSLAILLLMTMFMYICLSFNHQDSIYVSIALIQLMRPWMMSVLNAFIRIRFPPEHFDRLIGVTHFVTVIVMPLQYPILIWLQKSKVEKYRKKIADERYQHYRKDEESSEVLQNQNSIQSDCVLLNNL